MSRLETPFFMVRVYPAATPELVLEELKQPAGLFCLRASSAQRCFGCQGINYSSVRRRALQENLTCCSSFLHLKDQVWVSSFVCVWLA